MRDEPEMRNCFQCEVSLNMSQAKKGILLVNDYSHEEFGTAELGRDAGIGPGQPEVNLLPRRSSSHLWFYRGSAEGPAVPALEPRSTRRGASVPDEGQRIEPGPDHAAHRRLDADAAGAETTTPTAQFSPAVLQRRCGLAGRGGRRSRGAIRASHPSHSGARVQRLRQGRVRRAVGHLGFPHLQPAPFQDLSTVPGARAAHPTQSGVHCRAAQTRPPREARLPARGYGTSGSARWPAGAVYHLNAVDTVTQWEIVGCVETISERHLLPVLEAMLHQFPFRILGFHCDNGCEFINHQVAALLNKLLAEFTKSRAYRTTDNALVEGKNGAVVRKHIGYGPIGAPHAEELQKFFTAHFNPYLNYHRPCGFAVSELGAGGKKKRIYRTEDYQMPYEKLTSLSDWQQYLKEGLRPAALEQQAGQMSDTEAARRMKKAKLAVLQKCREKP